MNVPVSLMTRTRALPTGLTLMFNDIEGFHIAVRVPRRSRTARDAIDVRHRLLLNQTARRGPHRLPS
jgi:hypothetical protein